MSCLTGEWAGVENGDEKNIKFLYVQNAFESSRVKNRFWQSIKSAFLFKGQKLFFMQETDLVQMAVCKLVNRFRLSAKRLGLLESDDIEMELERGAAVRTESPRHLEDPLEPPFGVGDILQGFAPVFRQETFCE